MLTARKVAQYMLAHDTTGKLKDKSIVERNGRRFYFGNACLNKYLHIAQNLYIAKTGRQLFSDDLYAYDNGAVVMDVQENYGALLNNNTVPNIGQEESLFIDKILSFLVEASLDELIEISHEDSAWLEKHKNYTKREQLMDSEAHVDEYREQYADALFLLENMY